jgi:hypothetical protein
MGATLSASEQLTQNSTITTYVYAIIIMLVAIALYRNPDPFALLGILAALSFISYVYYQRWRYIPH